jgi:hypothetical protein
MEGSEMMGLSGRMRRMRLAGEMSASIVAGAVVSGADGTSGGGGGVVAGGGGGGLQRRARRARPT